MRTTAAGTIRTHARLMMCIMLPMKFSFPYGDMKSILATT
jgi:hypothetical protein